jgi:UrcA family protein
MTMLNFPNRASVGLLGVSCALAVLAAAAPATGEEPFFTVVGHSDRPQEPSLSAAVSYRDLDLTTKAGRKELHSRIWWTAVALCRQMGEPRGAAPFACEDEAVAGALGIEHAVIAHAAPRTYAAAEAPAGR